MRWRATCGVAMAAFILVLSLTPPARRLAVLPDRLRLAVGERKQLQFDLPVRLYVQADQSGALRLNGARVRRVWAVLPGRSLAIEPLRPGLYHLDVRVFGIIPLRRLTVDALPVVAVMPGGQAIGVLLATSGVLVVGETSLAVPEGSASPAREAGIRAGDVIELADGQPVRDKEMLAQLVQEAGRAGHSLALTIRRGEQTFVSQVRPRYDPPAGRYLIGAWVRDGTAGIGTMTFYDPGRHVFGALGHAVADPTTGQVYPVRVGAVVPAAVSGLERGRQGLPGEKLGSFLDQGTAWGRITQNTPVGIFGWLERVPDGGILLAPVPVAAEDEVHRGPAQILTVISGRRVQAFAVDIENVIPQDEPAAKGLLVHITDPRLLAATGGIVQGMSGSPILQDGRLVGAVTHVLVNDPTRGYGVFAVWMAEAAGLLPRQGQQAPEPAVSSIACRSCGGA